MAENGTSGKKGDEEDTPIAYTLRTERRIPYAKTDTDEGEKETTYQ